MTILTTTLLTSRLILEIATCAALAAFGAVAFSFSITSWKRWPKLTRCRQALMLSFIVVLATEILKIAYPGHEMLGSAVTFAECVIQLELLAVVSFVFIDPDAVIKRWLAFAFAPGVVALVLMVSIAVFMPRLIHLGAAISVVLLLAQIIYGGVAYGKVFHETIEKMSSYYDANYNRLYRLEMILFTDLGIGFVVTATTFYAHEFYPEWKLFFVLFYLLFTILFLNYEALASGIRQVNSHDEITETMKHSVPTLPAHGKDEFKLALEHWVANKSYLLADIPTEEIAHSLGVDITEFRSYFRDTLGKDFRTWRQELRIEEACHIMTEHPGYSYDTIAAMVGINDRSNFNKYFVKFKGCTPREWRANNLAG